MSRVNAILYSMLVVAALAMVGCAQGTTAKEYYILNVVRTATPAETKSDATVEVRRFNINTAFASRNLVYRLSEFQYEPDYYRQFMIAPAIMIAEETRHWLADSGLFKQVVPAGSPVTPTYTLQGIVTALYGDFTDKAAPTAVIRIRFFLTRHKDGEDTEERAEEAEHPTQDAKGEDDIAAVSPLIPTGRDRILARVE